MQPVLFSETDAYPAECRGRFCEFRNSGDLLAPAHDIPLTSSAWVAVVDSAGRWGYVTDIGECFFPIQYEQTLDVLAEYANVCVSSRKAYIDRNGRLFPLLATGVTDTETGAYLTVERHESGWMIRTSIGTLVSQFHDVQSYFHEGRALFEKSCGWKYVDANGRPIFAPPSPQAGHYKNGRARFLDRGKWGFVDLRGEVIIEPQFEAAWNFSEGLAAVELSGRWVYINELATVVIDGQFRDARDFSEGLAKVSPDVTFTVVPSSPGRRVERCGLYGFIDRSGQYVVSPQFQTAKDFSEGLAAVQVGSQWGYIDPLGKLRIPPVYSWVSSFHQGLACVTNGDRYGYLDRSGEVAVAFEYTKAFDYSEGLAAIQRGLAWGFIDTAGTCAIAPTFKDVSPFRDGRARAARTNKFGYIDRTGNWAIPPQYDAATSFSEGLALVQKGKVRSCIDPNGNTIFVA